MGAFRDFISAIEDGWEGVVGATARGVLGVLSPRRRARFSERIGRFHRLDYPKADLVMLVHSEMTWKRTRECAKEPETVAWLEQHVQPGDVIYDVGANVGAYSLVASVQAKGEVEVYAFEPHAGTYATLVRNVQANARANIHPLCMALDASSGLAQMTGFEAGAGHGLAFEAKTKRGRSSSRIQPVLRMRLDDLVYQLGLPHPTVLKLDSDRNEPAVLQGASRVLSDPRLRTVLVETDESSDHATEIRHALDRAGLRLASRTRHGDNGVGNEVHVREGQASRKPQPRVGMGIAAS